MKFRDLKLGARFRFEREDNLNFKISSNTYQVISTGGVWCCHVDSNCIVAEELPDAKAFKYLVIGARFRFPESLEHLVKVSKTSFQAQNNSIIACDYNFMCIPVFKVLTFGDLDDGDKFKFTDRDVEYLKIAKSAYLPATKIRCASDATVERSET